MKRKIKNALISLSDKSELNFLLKCLRNHNINIISSGGTFKKIKKLGYKSKEVSDFTKFDEILGGRVKTLHPIIHAGILAKSQKDLDELKDSKYSIIDVVVVNLYPFENTISKRDCSFEDAIENIDIGGPTLLRASAKNHQRVTVLTEPSDYSQVLDEIDQNGSVKASTRLNLAAKVFSKVSRYDALIASYLNKVLNGERT